VAARKTLTWGIPVLESSLTLIDGGRLYYRGHDARALARHAQFEDVVRLLWSEDGTLDLPAAPISGKCREALRQLQKLPTWNRLQAILPFAAADDAAAFDTGAVASAATGWRILCLLTAAATRQTVHTSQPIAAQLAKGWNVRTRAARRLLDLALILCADHELNVSAFTARCVASAGASPYDTVSAALAALKGSRHGGESARVSALLAEIGSPARTRSVVANRLRQGERIPGFGHPLYPGGDPRAERLVRLAERSGHTREWALVRSVRAAAADLLQEQPNLDFGLAAIARTYRLPEQAPLILFALGRTAGWVAHAIEQYATATLIRPRARYTGPLPDRM
jgi:citrate synthase